MGIAIGIDLGTTNSAIAVVRPDGRPEILKNREGAATTPSVVLFQDFGGGDEPLVGEQAKRQAGINPTDVVQHVKRYMGECFVEVRFRIWRSVIALKKCPQSFSNGSKKMLN